MKWDDVMYEIMGWVLMKILVPATLIFIIFSVTVLPYWIYQDENRPTFELKKVEFECTKTHEERHCPKGCYMISICDRYDRQ